MSHIIILHVDVILLSCKIQKYSTIYMCMTNCHLKQFDKTSMSKRLWRTQETILCFWVKPKPKCTRLYIKKYVGILMPLYARGIISTCNINMLTSHLFMSTCKIIMLTCNLIQLAYQHNYLICRHNFVACQYILHDDINKSFVIINVAIDCLDIAYRTMPPYKNARLSLAEYTCIYMVFSCII